MNECHSRCVNTCFHTKQRECYYALTQEQRDQAAIARGDYITTVAGVRYTDGSVGNCYALVAEGSGYALTIKRAAELERIGFPYKAAHTVYPDDFTSWFPPDFPMVGEPRKDR